jgi:hypothetical protein
LSSLCRFVERLDNFNLTRDFHGNGCPVQLTPIAKGLRRVGCGHETVFLGDMLPLDIKIRRCVSNSLSSLSVHVFDRDGLVGVCVHN